jgi:hypothetical protein
MSEPRSTVIAGSKGFVDAVEAHLKLRHGLSPTVAKGPEDLSAANGGGLIVLEYAGAPWLEAIRAVRGSSQGDLAIIAAVSVAQASDVTPLQKAGVDEVVRWQGRVDPVLWAVDRITSRARSKAAAESIPVLGGPSQMPSKERGFDIRELAPGEAPAAPPAQDEPRAEPAEATIDHGGVKWPLFVPSAEDAEVLLGKAATGAPVDGVPKATVERVLLLCSEAERAVLKGEPVTVDPLLLRAAAGLRLRLAIALADRPATPDEADEAGAQALLSDVDALLARLKSAMGENAAVAGPALEPIRNAIVGGGVDLAGALSRLVPEGSPEAEALERRQKQPVARVLSNENAEMGSVALLVGGYHAWRYIGRPRPVAPPTLAGAPANTTTITRGGVKLLTVLAGKPVDSGELEKFRAMEQAKGNTVREVSAGTWAIEPAKSEGGGKP